MEFGIFNLMGSREADKPAAQVFGEVAEQTKLADELGYTIAWFAEHHFSNYCLCASPLDDGGALRLDHQEDPARHRGRGVAAVQPGAARRRDRHGRRVVERPADARHRRRLSALRIRAVRRRHRPEPRDDRRVLRHPRPRLQPGFLQLQRQALPDAGNAHPGAPGAEPAADLRRRPYPGDVPRRRAARLSGADVGPGRRRQVAGRAVCRHRRRVCRRERARCRGRTSPSTASPTSPTAARKGCASPRTRAISRGSRRACGAGRKSCRAPCWSMCRSPTSRRSRPSTTIC